MARRLSTDRERGNGAEIVEFSDDAIVGTTLDGMITSWNAGAERLYGYTAREVIGRWPIAITIPEDALPEILVRVGRGERVDHYETVGVRKNGRRISKYFKRLRSHSTSNPVGIVPKGAPPQRSPGCRYHWGMMDISEAG